MPANDATRPQDPAALTAPGRRMALRIAAGAGVLGLTVCAGFPAARAQAMYKVSAEQLQQAVGTRFPLRYPLAGLLELTLNTPRLRLLPEQNRLGADVPLELGGPAAGRTYAGALDLDFALRYEAEDRSIRAHELRLRALRFPDMPPDASALLNAYVPAVVEQSLGEVVLHRLRAQDLALAETMGMQPGSVTVTAEGLVIGFVPRTRP